MKRKSTSKPNGYILHEDKDRVVIANGFTRKSKNSKTGPMIQVWILHRHISPMAAIRTGRDNKICGTCKWRGLRKLMADGQYRVIRRRCYVQVDKAPTAIWGCYRRGNYQRLDRSDYPEVFRNRKVRFGAYGDPYFIPTDILGAITQACANWTGYSHQIADASYADEHRGMFMSSVDSLDEALRAHERSERYFRVRGPQEPLLPWEIVCPASKEGGNRTTCERCMLCNGNKHGANDPRKSVSIIDHSRIARSAPLIQLTIAA